MILYHLDYELMAVQPKSRASTADAAKLRASVSPNSVGDQPTNRDTLGFKPYVDAVAAFLNHPETLGPLTLSVEGAWGSGKSSFMWQLEERIKAKNGLTVWFNAWRHEHNEELWADFALHFTNELARCVPTWKKWLYHLKLSYSRFDWRRGWFPLTKFLFLVILSIFLTINASRFWLAHESSFKQLFTSVAESGAEKKSQNTAPIPIRWEELLVGLLLGTGGVGVYVLLGFGVFRKIGEILSNPLEIPLADYLQDPKYEARAAAIETFHSDFTRLVHTYAQGRKVFVFIDDLDRCEIPRAADLMQALNLLISESAPVFYVLGLDREKIAAGLAAKYEKLIPYLATKKLGTTSGAVIGIEFGYSFLEKFIQIPFLVPQPSDHDLDGLLDSLGSGGTENQSKQQGTKRAVDAGLLVELSSDSASVREIVKMVAPSLEYNPRRLKQFINLFRLRALLASQTGLFGNPTHETEVNALTFEQLGKLVAIMLRWPMLLTDLQTDSTLLGRLQTFAWSGDRSVQESDSTLQYWSNKLKLIELIAYPNGGGTGLKEAERLKYSLARIDVERILQIAPLVPGRALFDSPSEQPHSRINMPKPPRGQSLSEEEPGAKREENWGKSSGPDSGSGSTKISSEPDVYESTPWEAPRRVNKQPPPPSSSKMK